MKENNINKEQVEYIEKLAHMGVTEVEKQKFEKEIGAIIGFVQKLNELDTGKVKPTYHIVPVKNVVREDKLGESLNQNDVLGIAPVKDRGHYKVPKIIE